MNCSPTPKHLTFGIALIAVVISLVAHISHLVLLLLLRPYISLLLIFYVELYKSQLTWKTPCKQLNLATRRTRRHILLVCHELYLENRDNLHLISNLFISPNQIDVCICFWKFEFLFLHYMDTTGSRCARTLRYLDTVMKLKNVLLPLQRTNASIVLTYRWYWSLSSVVWDFDLAYWSSTVLHHDGRTASCRPPCSEYNETVSTMSFIYIYSSNVVFWSAILHVYILVSHEWEKSLNLFDPLIPCLFVCIH